MLNQSVDQCNLLHARDTLDLEVACCPNHRFQFPDFHVFVGIVPPSEREECIVNIELLSVVVVSSQNFDEDNLLHRVYAALEDDVSPLDHRLQFDASHVVHAASDDCLHSMFV